jgi:hypothetical protein
VATVIFDNNADDYVVSLGMRSKEVGTYPSCLHVIPAGMCNTHRTEWLRGEKQSVVPDWFVRTTMRSEFLEEWFDYQKLEREATDVLDWRQDVDRAWKEARIGDQQILLTGLAYDLLNLRPEICGVVLVDRWGDKLCWEYISISGRAYEDYPLMKVGIGEATGPTRIVQSGAAALFLAQRRSY